MLLKVKDSGIDPKTTYLSPEFLNEPVSNYSDSSHLLGDLERVNPTRADAITLRFLFRYRYLSDDELFISFMAMAAIDDHSLTLGETTPALFIEALNCQE